MSDRHDCLLREEFRTLGWEICRRTGYNFNDIYIYWHEIVREHVVVLNGKFAGYVEDFWQQGHIYNHYCGEDPILKKIKPLSKQQRLVRKV